MNREEQFKYILELQEKQIKDEVDFKIRQAKEKNKQDAINFAIQMTTQQMHQNMMALLVRGLK